MITRRTSIARVGVLALVAAVAGCHGREDREAAERLLRTYNRAVIEAHLTRSMAPVEKLVSQDEYQRLEIVLVGLTKRGEVLRASLEELEVRSAALDEEKGSGMALTTERWAYERVDPKTGEVKLAKTDASYRLKYDLRRIDGTWRVHKVRHEGQTGEEQAETPARAPDPEAMRRAHVHGMGDPAPKDGAGAPAPKPADVVRENTQ